MITRENSTLNMQDTIAFFKKLFTAPHLAYAEAMTLFTPQQRWRYFRIAMNVTVATSVIPSLLVFAMVSGTEGVTQGAVYPLVTLTIVFFVYSFTISFVPKLLHLVGGWFKGQATVEELRDLCAFNYFVWMSLGAFALLSILFFPLSVILCLIIQILCLVFFVKGLQHVQKYDLLDAIFTAGLSYIMVMIFVLVCFAIFTAGLVSVIGFKSSMLGF